MQPPRTQIWIDRGGTFTDCLAWDPVARHLRVRKVLSSDLAPIEGIRALFGIGPDDPIPPCDVRMGTTLATNALLERRGAPTGLLVSRGFGDLLRIRDQRRADLFTLEIEEPPVLYSEVLEVDARLDAAGVVLERPEPEGLVRDLARMRSRGVESVAVVLLHAYRDGTLEREIGALARRAGFERVSLSHEVAAEMGLLARGATSVVDAYLAPLVSDYLRELMSRLPGSTLRIMKSSGGLTDAAHFSGRDAVLSGPAAGLVAAARAARDTPHGRIIAFDMGGTSTDVSRYAGEIEHRYESSVAGVQLRAPMVDVHTIAAGGGSICRYEGGRFVVGPQSAGARPGPLCYGRPEATELTLTDVNLALGRLRSDRFPFPLDRGRVDAALDGIAEQLDHRYDPKRAGRLRVAEGFFRVAVENMAAAIRRVSVERGHDVRDHALVAFGGASGQHACAVARLLGIRTILSHPLGGVLSAWGMGAAPLSWHGESHVAGVALGGGLLRHVRAPFAELEERARLAMRTSPRAAGHVQCVRRLDLRYRGAESALTVRVAEDDDDGALRRRFEAQHRREFGYARAGHPIEAMTARLEAVVESSDLDEVERAGWPEGAGRSPPETTTALWFEGAFVRVPVLHREVLAEGTRRHGPLLVLEQTGTLVIEPGFEMHVDARRMLVIEDRRGDARSCSGSEAAASVDAARGTVDPVLLEVFNNRFMSIAEQMGAVLRRTALSTNIRDRLDFSCALFDAEGRLVANAPHIPVHLGSMGETVRAIRDAHPDASPGDVFVTNDPARGGSHLPDVTVVSPVHLAEGELCFYVASRGHHADIGGTTPGSMPPSSTTLDEEGVVLRSMRVVHAGRFDRALLRRSLTSGAHPARRPDDNIADLRAQIAANHRGCRLLAELVDRHGLSVVRAYMGHSQDNAELLVREAIREMPDGVHRFADALDDGTPIRVAVSVDRDRMHIDFEGTGPQVRGNLNAPPSVTVASVLYVLRTLVGAPIPLNSGCLRPVEIRVPPHSLLCPDPGRAVAGGNVETSQRVVDVLLGAIGRVAASQGTMNNITFGDSDFGYYETIGGGAGAGPGFDGASGVHTHMTNSRITDPEVLESRLPVRLLRFALRPGSGGSGRWRGGDGLVRELEFLEPLRVSLLSERRVRAPYGAAGGADGALGRNLHNGRALPGKVGFHVEAGDRVTVETPGGGGWGSP